MQPNWVITPATLLFLSIFMSVFCLLFLLHVDVWIGRVGSLIVLVALYSKPSYSRDLFWFLLRQLEGSWSSALAQAHRKFCKVHFLSTHTHIEGCVHHLWAGSLWNIHAKFSGYCFVRKSALCVRVCQFIVLLDYNQCKLKMPLVFTQCLKLRKQQSRRLQAAGWRCTLQPRVQRHSYVMTNQNKHGEIAAGQLEMQIIWSKSESIVVRLTSYAGNLKAS